MNPLWTAIYKGHKEMVSLLVNAKAALENGIDDENTPLLKAVTEDYVDIVRILVDAKANVDACTNVRKCALEIAALYCNSTDVVNILIDAKAHVDARNQKNQTALMAAAILGKSGIVQALLSANADVNAKTMDNDTALLYAALSGDVNTTSLLLSAKATVDAETNDNTTALMRAACNPAADFVEYILLVVIDHFRDSSVSERRACDVSPREVSHNGATKRGYDEITQNRMNCDLSLENSRDRETVCRCVI